MDTPVVLIVFNRPALPRRVLQRLRAARPQQMMVVADGPRTGHAEDPIKVAETRALVNEQIDWPLESLLLHKRFGGDAARRRASLLGRLRLDRLWAGVRRAHGSPAA